MEGAFDIVAPGHVDEPGQNSVELSKQAMANRVEFKQAALDRSIAERGKADTWMKFLPSFDATFNWNWNSAAGFAGDNETWMLIFGARWNLFDGGDRISELKTRDSLIRMADNTKAQLYLDVRKEIDQNYQEVIQRRRNMDMADKQVALAEENHSLISRQYEVGIVSSLDVLDASTELSTKRITRVLERLQYDIAVLKLKKAAGEYSSLALVPFDK
jgi:outer membrane protein TolC